ncbi:hypothetical protein [Vibrio marisflavi]|uniref:Uncharacterized protein n=1 Tax=Vibrio marisflavi CECT 7928 TaxID=634439 RepID=A0ABM8ZZC2_9VIBR|nr:hypothetical protein [Vibrio marisflavi]CAH0536352.1 hypothetical protein VMF7928_00364 [Vibrio marisflavi CECT 7928]
MSNLKESLFDIQINQLQVINKLSETWLWFCDRNQSLFEKACTNKPEKKVTDHLLGIATKQHIECLDKLNQQAETVAALEQAFEQNIGKKHSKKFQYQDKNQLILTTHIWLYLQGYLGLAFSLSNEYATQTAQVLADTSNQVQSIRTEFLESYYLGLDLYKARSKHQPFRWLRKLLGR